MKADIKTRDYVDIQCGYCGTPFRAILNNLTRNTRSCGCLLIKFVKRLNYKHGHAGGGYSRTYKSWDAMWQRVTNPKNIGYKNYGGRGITIHPEWGLFENFLRDIGKPDL